MALLDALLGKRGSTRPRVLLVNTGERLTQKDATHGDRRPFRKHGQHVKDTRSRDAMPQTCMFVHLGW